MSSNPFVGSTIGPRYATARPAFHHEVVALLADRLPAPRRALDVGCGTGLSTRPLGEIADEVVGIDISGDMLAATTGAPGVRFMRCSAQDLAFRDASFGLVTTSSSIHWIDRDAFLPEAVRVLSTDGHLVTYDDHFRAEMREVPVFSPWMHDVYATTFPQPPRDWFEPSQAPPHLFRHVWSAELRRDWPMSLDGLTRYLMTQSNTLAVVHAGTKSEADVTRWLEHEMAPFFDHDRAVVRHLGFVTRIACLVRGS